MSSFTVMHTSTGLQVPFMTAFSIILTAAMGFRLWRNPYSFNKTGSIEEIDCVIIQIPFFLLKGHFSTKWLRGLSLYCYILLLVTGIALFMGMAAAYTQRCCGIDDDGTDEQSESPEEIKCHPSISISMGFYLLFGTIFGILAIELTMNANRHLQNSDEAVWSLVKHLLCLSWWHLCGTPSNLSGSTSRRWHVHVSEHRSVMVILDNVSGPSCMSICLGHDSNDLKYWLYCTHGLTKSGIYVVYVRFLI